MEGITLLSRKGADRILAKLIQREGEQLAEALGAHNYDKVRIVAKQMAGTLRAINKEMEARK